MVTDTAFMRNPHYHAPTDLPHTLDYDRMADLTSALAAWLATPVSAGPAPAEDRKLGPTAEPDRQHRRQEARSSRRRDHRPQSTLAALVAPLPQLACIEALLALVRVGVIEPGPSAADRSRHASQSRTR